MNHAIGVIPIRPLIGTLRFQALRGMAWLTVVVVLAAALVVVVVALHYR